MGSGIEYGEIFAKAMFAAQMIEFDLSNRAPSMWASDDIAAMASAAGGGKFGNMSAELAMLQCRVFAKWWRPVEPFVDDYR